MRSTSRVAEFAGQGYAVLKRAIADAIIATLDPIRRRYHELFAQPGTIDAVLVGGAKRARPLADATLERGKQLRGVAAAEARDLDGVDHG